MKALTMERLMRLSVAVLALVCAPSLLAEARIATNGPSPATNAVEGVNWTAGVAYSYDGSGNIRQIGNDRFVYDRVGRLTQAEVNGVVRTYTYDAFGNRTNCLHAPGTGTESDCQWGMTIDPKSNRVIGVEYDRAGNVETFSGHHYSYDAVNMVTRDDRGNGLEKEFIYTAGDERIATYTVGSTWNWTIREVGGKVLREFSSDDSGSAGPGTGSWRLIKDYVWRDGLLLASRHVVNEAPVTYHYHLDHLGTPRRVTDHTDRIVGFHDYYAFGPEVSGGLTEPSPTSLQYTGHERDKWGGGEGLDTLDYMHARYNSPALGRFLSVDPAADSVELTMPQSWNRYSYALNNPLMYIDPTGRVFQCSWTGEGDKRRMFCAEWVDVEAKAPKVGEGGSPPGQGGSPPGRSGFTHASRDEAALQAVSSVCATSVRIDREFGGVLYEADGSFAFSPPRQGTNHSMKGVLGANNVWGAAAFMSLLPPPGVRIVGTYHTHGAYSKGRLDEAFSPGDRKAALKEGLAAYLGTPSGRVLRYDPRTPSIRAWNAFDFQLGTVPCE